MTKYATTPTNIEHRLAENEIIVSKTDVKGRITYANTVFLKFSGYEEDEIIGAPHSTIRHPDMPRCVFKLLWDRIGTDFEIFAYVKNMCKNGDFYWVFAHVTPTKDSTGNVIGYHSNRRCPSPAAIAEIEGIYRVLLEEEQKYPNDKDGMNAGTALLTKVLEEQGLSYDEFIFQLTERSLAA